MILACLWLVATVALEADWEARWALAAPDGLRRPVIRLTQGVEMGGPTLWVEEDEWLNVTIWNRLQGELLSVHWHGLHQKNNAWCDGSQGVSECGTLERNRAHYVFQASPAGTHWYHAHVASLYVDGLVGALVVRPKIDWWLTRFNYTRDHVAVVRDWHHSLSLIKETWARGSLYPWPPDSILINGRGQFQNLTGKPAQFACDFLQYARFRFINAGAALSLRVYIDQHMLRVIARDGVDVFAETSTALTLAPGQRVDALVFCNQSSDFSYYIVAAISPHYEASSPNSTLAPNISSYAVLNYGKEDNPLSPLSLDPGGDAMATAHSLFGDNMFLPFFQLPIEKEAAPPADQRVVFVSQSRETNDSGEVWETNGQLFSLGGDPWLQSVYLGKEIFPSPVAVEEGSTVEVVLVNNDLHTHPWHLHGHTAWLLGSFLVEPEFDVSERYRVDEGLFVPFNYSLYEVAPLSQEVRENVTRGDTFVVPPKGFVVLRFQADNPGPWLLHCHNQWHMAQGMALLFSVQKAAGGYSLGPPPADFSFCGSSALWGACPPTACLWGGTCVPDPQLNWTCICTEDRTGARCEQESTRSEFSCAQIVAFTWAAAAAVFLLTGCCFCFCRRRSCCPLAAKEEPLL